jgi:hypothetical protein
VPGRPWICALALVCVPLWSCAILDEAGDTTTTTATPGPTTTTIPPGTPIAFEGILPGQCFDKVPSPDQQPYAAMLIPCEQPHTYELYTQLTYTDDAGKKANLSVVYPGETVVRTRAEALCFAEFEPWIGTSWTKSDFDVEVWWPSAISWDQRDRTVLCAAYPYDGKRTSGSARGSGV